MARSSSGLLGRYFMYLDHDRSIEKKLVQVKARI